MPMTKKQKAWLILVPALLLVGVVRLFYFWLFPPFTPPVLPVPNGYDDLLRAAEMLALRTGFYNEMDETELASVVEQNRPALALARDALQKECMVPINWSPDQNWNEVVYRDYSQSMRELARAFAAAALQANRQGQAEEAVQCGLDTMQIASATANGGLLLDNQVARAIQNLGLWTLRQHIDLLSRQECQRLQEQLRGELLALEPIDTFVQRDKEYYRKLNGPWNTFMMRSVAASQLQAVIDSRKVTEQRLETLEQLLQTHIALRLYQLDHGKFPEQLDKLVPDYLSEVPQDIFSGKPLIYRPQGDSYLLYSVGPDGKDDNGVATDENQAGDLLLESE